MNLVYRARRYAINCHEDTNHLYDDKPYEIHLQMVFDAATKYAHLVPEKDRDSFLAAAWAHDVIEDCRQTYNDVLSATSKEVADLVYALTNEKGKTRRERAGKKYYDDMKKVAYAPLLKACDRLANLKYSISTGSKMAEMYRKENPDFVFQLNDPLSVEVYDELFLLCNEILTK